MLLTTTEAVAAFCARLHAAPFVTVDTEFLTEKTYRPDLCLIQLGAPGLAAAIDPLAEGIDLAPVAELLADATLLKVMHAGRQDVAIFVHLFGAVPAPLTDTQVMASVCGFGDQAGYATLCQELLDVAIDKSSQATDWSVRPLTEAQITYALGDVVHLCDLYTTLDDRLASLGRSEWVGEELAALVDPTAYEVNAEAAWERVRIRRPTPRTLAVVQALAAWRETTAAQRNLPRGWLVRDEALVEIAEQLPSNPDELGRVRRISASVAKGRDGRAMLAIVAGVLNAPEESWPQPEATTKPTSPQRALLQLLQALLELRCAEHDVGTRLVASSADLRRLVLGDLDDHPALVGWRAEVFGHDALALVQGHLGLTGGPDGAEIRRLT